MFFVVVTSIWLFALGHVPAQTEHIEGGGRPKRSRGGAEVDSPSNDIESHRWPQAGLLPDASLV